MGGYTVLGDLEVLRSSSFEGVLLSTEQRKVTWREVGWIRWPALHHAPIYEALHFHGRKNSPATQCRKKLCNDLYLSQIFKNLKTIFQFMLRVMRQSSVTFHDTWNCFPFSLTAAHNLKVRTLKVLISLCGSFKHSKTRTRDLHPLHKRY
jgi:hypothetical protein